MKKIIVTLLIVFTFSSVSSAKTVTLSWDPSPSPDVAGYKLYYKNSNVALPFDGIGATEGASPIDFGNTMTAVITGLSDIDTHYFTVTAYDGAGYESAYSNIVASNPVVPDLDSSWSSSDGIPLGTKNLVTKVVSLPGISSITKYEAVVTKGEVSCFSLNVYFDSGETMMMIYAKDLDTGNIISSQTALFVDGKYKNHKACVVYQANSLNTKVFLDYGQDAGTYEFQKMILTTSFPDKPPVQNFWLTQMLPATIAGSKIDDVWSWQEPVPNPTSYRVVIAKTLKSVLGLEPESLYGDLTINNSGQLTFSMTVVPILEEHGYFISIRSIYDGIESEPVIKAHLPGNVTGTPDDSPPTLFGDVNINRIDDTIPTYSFYRTRAIPGGGYLEVAKSVERASITNYRYVIRYDYYYVRSREGRYLLMRKPL